MKKCKKVLSAALAFTMAVGAASSLAACGLLDDEYEDTDEVKYVRVWLHKSEAEDEGKAYKALEEAFNAEGFTTSTGRTVQMKLDFKNSAEALSTAINAEQLGGNLPDVVAVDAPNVAAYADAKILTDISSYISNETLSDYVESVIEQGTYNGKLYALSGADSPTGLYYNKKLLKAVGYKDEDFGTIENPWTWDQVREAMDALHNAGKSYQINLNLGFGGKEGGMYLFSSLVYSANGTFVGSNGKATGALNSAASVNGIKQIEQLFDSVEGTNGSYVAQSANTASFPSGDVAFEVYGTWTINLVEKSYRNFINDYAVMPMPVYKAEDGTKGKTYAGCGSWCFGVTPNTRDKEASAMVVEYLTNADSSETIAETIGTFPTHKSSLEDDKFKTGVRGTFAELLTRTAKPRPIMVNYPQLTDGYADILQYIQTSYGKKSDYDLQNYVNGRCVSIDAGQK